MKTRTQKTGKRFSGWIFRIVVSGSKQVQFLATMAMIATIAAAMGLSSCAGYTTNAAGTTSQNGVSAGILSAGTSTLNFGNVPVGTSATQSLTLTDTGTAPVSIAGVTVSGTGFSVVGGNFTGTIGAGQSVAVQLQFAPQSAGSLTGDVTITSNAPGSTVSIGLSGTGLEALGSVNPASVAFGNVVVGSSNSAVVTIKNTGNVTLSFSQVSVSGSGFSISGLSTSSTIPAGGSLNFDAVFTPVSATSASGSITLATNGSPAQIAIPLTGTGTAAAQTLSVSSSSLSFGNVQVGSTSTLTATITNSGNSNVSISGVTVSGAGYTASGVTSGMVLSPNQSATLTINFAPMSLGSDPGTISITSNATNSPTTILLAGESHTVLLTWTGSTSTGVTGYYVYREAQSGQYAKLNASSPASGTQFTDTTVAAGTTYNYVVTAVDSSGVESSYSSPATVSVP